ncbi:ABC transporter permease [Christensenella tenuis]|jgi:putative ABC transport system permease protein|uniref:ABC transporter permease n=1 Tax=Christensenella tenuis TaxID=2763033 RepID=A0ABR7EIZ8_9FIRM|nr:ABC transporter permease [Christensenella tenuis]MBC5648984.1 ABC transporter permease [Christensenella tenuis]
MTILKRSLLYLTRKKGRNILLFFILLTMSFFLLIGTMLTAEAGNAADEIRRSMGASFCFNAIVDTQDDSLWITVNLGDGNEGRVYNNPAKLTDEMAGQVMQVSGVSAYNGSKSSWEYTSLKLKPGFHILTHEDYLAYPEEYEGRDDMIESVTMYRNFAPLIGNTDSSLNPFFRNNALSLREGRHIQPGDEWKAVVSSYVAGLNGLQVGDTFEAGITQAYVDYMDGLIPGLQPFGPKEYEIVGIFDVNFTQAANEYSSEWDMPENFIMTDNKSVGEIAEAAGGASETFETLTFFVEEPLELDAVIAEVKKLDLPWQYLSIDKDDTSYLAFVKPVEAVKALGTFMTVFAAGSCMMIEYLLFHLWIKGRRREIGILLSVGIGKQAVLRQLLLEGFIIIGIAFALACVLASCAAQPMGDAAESLMYRENVTETYKVFYNEAQNLTVEPVGGQKAELVYMVTAADILVIGICSFIIVALSVFLSFRGIFREKPGNLLRFAEDSRL